MNCLNSSVSEDRMAAGAIARAGVGAYDTTRVDVRVRLPLVGTAPVSSFSLISGGFRQGLQRAESLAIALAR